MNTFVSGRRHLRCVACLLAIAVPGNVAAQSDQAPATPPARFETEIIVTPERGETPRAVVPSSTFVLDGTRLAALPAIHPSETLSFLTGFSIARPQFYAGRPVVSARGFFGGGEAEYVLLLVDGSPVADVESGLVDWSAIPASSIQRIEASRGPGAAVYGDSAVGGVIHILSNRNNRGHLTASAGSFQTFTVDGSQGRQLPAFGLHASGAIRTTAGGFEHSAGQELVGAGSADGTRGALSWRWNAAGDNRYRDEPGVRSREASVAAPYGSDPIYRFDRTDRWDASTALTLRHTAMPWRPQLRVHSAVRDENLIRTILLAPNLGDRRARELSSAAVGASLEGGSVFNAAGPTTVRFGLDVSHESLDTSYRSVGGTGTIGALDSAASGRRLRTGVFASTSWEPASRVRVSGALRWDTADDAGFDAPVDPGAGAQRAWSPRGGIVLRLDEAGTATLFVQASKAFKVPTLDQRFDPRPYPDFRGGTFTISNPDLVPQRASNLEAGISGGTSIRWSALAYRIDVADEIDFDVATFSYANIGQSQHVGIETEVEGRLWDGIQPSITYAHSLVTAADDAQLKNVPRHQLTAAAQLDLPGAIGAYAQYRRTWGAFLDDANAFPLDGTSTIDLRVRRSLGRHLLFLDVLNATGDVYEEYGFTLADFRGRLVPYAYPGAPRAVRAGLTLTW